MLVILLFFVTLFVMVLNRIKNDRPRVVKAAEAAKYIGHKLQVRGVVWDVKAGKDGEINIHFGDKYPRQTFTAHIPAISELAGEEWIMTLRGQVIGIPGVIEEVEGKPTIEVLSVDQIVGANA